MWRKLLYIKRCKVHWKFLPPKFDFGALVQNFIEYFYPLNWNFNADFQKFNAEIPFTPSYLELWLFTHMELWGQALFSGENNKIELYASVQMQQLTVFILFYATGALQFRTKLKFFREHFGHK